MEYLNIKILKNSEEVQEVRLNRPEIHNAFNEQMIEELTHFFQQKFKGEGSKTRLVILSAEGKSFSAGADLNWMKSLINKTKQENKEDALKLSTMFQAIDDCPLPILGKIQGPAYGGGVGLMAVCDEVIMANGTQWGLTEASLGLVPAVISPFVIRKIGYSQARRLFISAERLDADEALKMGLVHLLVKAEDLEQTLEQRIKIFMKASPSAQREAKNLAKTYAPKADVDYLTDLIARIRVSGDAQEGMKSLLEKRRPVWS